MLINIQELIKDKLLEIEQKENVKIIYAAESGSRAWGFASPDSDYDVRFIYIRNYEHYLRLDKTRDVIEYILNDELDISGWDLSKALKLLHSSNPTLFEWCNSPIVYRTTPEFDELKRIIYSYFSGKPGLYHYLNMAESNYREYLKGEYVRIKKYFYVLRPILACRWILDKNCPPPMLFTELVESQLEGELKPIIYQLIDDKMITSELGERKRIDKLNEFIEKNIPLIKEQISLMPKVLGKGYNELNEIFIRLINTK